MNVHTIIEMLCRKQVGGIHNSECSYNYRDAVQETGRRDPQ